jgi:hypothetical protein
LSEQAERIYATATALGPLSAEDFDGWQWALENATDVTFLAMDDARPVNLATRLAYQECAVTHWPFVLIQANKCQGAGDDLWEQYVGLGGPQA